MKKRIDARLLYLGVVVFVFFDIKPVGGLSVLPCAMNDIMSQGVHTGLHYIQMVV